MLKKKHYCIIFVSGRQINTRKVSHIFFYILIFDQQLHKIIAEGTDASNTQSIVERVSPFPKKEYKIKKLWY